MGNCASAEVDSSSHGGGKGNGDDGGEDDEERKRKRGELENIGSMLAAELIQGAGSGKLDLSYDRKRKKGKFSAAAFDQLVGALSAALGVCSWEQITDGNQTWYYDKATGETTWQRPEEYREDVHTLDIANHQVGDECAPAIGKLCL